MRQNRYVRNGRLTRRAMVAGGAALIGARSLVPATAQTPAASPAATPGASPVATPAASPGASPVATLIASPTPDYPLDIVWVGDLPDDGEPVRGGTLRLPVRRASLLDFVPTLQRQDPQVAWSYLDALVRVDPETGLPVPSLARSWQWSDDGLTLTFTLRDDVTWHDDTPFTAADARFAHITYRDDYRSVIAGQSALVSEVVAEDETTLRVEFSEPDGAWIFNVASLPVFQRAQYSAWWEANPVGERTLEGITFDEAPPVGTGPWMIEEAAPGGIALVRNTGYFQTPPNADRLELVPVDDQAERISRWREGDLHLVGSLGPSRVERLLNDEGRLVVADQPRTLFAAFNFDNPGRWEPDLLADPVVREAISLTLDRERYAEEIWGGFLRADRAGIVAQPWVDGAERRNPAQDIDRARELLEEAGWEDTTGDGMLESPAGDAFVLTALVLDSVAPEVVETLEAMHADLRKIGGGVAINRVPRDRFVAWYSEERTWDLVVYDLRLYPAFQEFDLIGSAWDIRSSPAGWNPGGYRNPDADEAIERYFAAVDVDDMSSALADLQEAITEDPFALWLGFPQDLTLVAPEVRGFVPNPIWSTLDTRLMWLDESD